MRTPESAGALPLSSAFDQQGQVRTQLLREQSQFFLGVDLGKAQDYSAFAVIERAELVTPERDPVTMEHHEEVRCWLRHVERVPLGTPYPEVVERVWSMVRAEPLARRTTVVVDGTGVGAPIVDLLRRTQHGRPAGLYTLVPVIITGGDTESTDGATWRVPKRDLMAGLQVAFGTRRLEVAAALPALPLLIEELRGMRVRTTADGGERFGGRKDDLVLALALAWWRASRYVGIAGRKRMI